MNETMQIRLPGSVLSALKEIAEAQHTTISKLFSEVMKEVVSKGVTVPVKEVAKGTSLYVDRDTADAFRKRLAEDNVPFDKAVRVVAEDVLKKFH